MEYTKSPFLDSFCRALACATTARGAGTYDRAIVLARIFYPSRSGKGYGRGVQLRPAILRLSNLLEDAEAYLKSLQKHPNFEGNHVWFGLTVTISRDDGRVESLRLQAAKGRHGLRLGEYNPLPEGWIAVPTKHSYQFYASTPEPPTLPMSYQDPEWVALAEEGLPYLRVTSRG